MLDSKHTDQPEKIVEISVRRVGKVTILDVSGPMSIARGHVLREKFRASLEDVRPLYIFNLVAVPYMDSGALAEMVACLKRVRDRDGGLKLVVTPAGKIEEIFRLTALDRVFETYDDEEAALASFIP